MLLRVQYKNSREARALKSWEHSSELPLEYFLSFWSAIWARHDYCDFSLGGVRFRHGERFDFGELRKRFMKKRKWYLIVAMIILQSAAYAD
jgi:hypothetical protein